MRIAHAFRLAAAAALLTGAAACDRSPTGGDHADAAAVSLTVGAQTLTVTSTGVQTGGLTLAQGTHAVVVAWLDADGDAIANPGSGLSLEIVAAAGTSGVSFTSSSLFGGTLNATTAGEKTMSVRLMHGTHADFSQTVTFTVQ